MSELQKTIDIPVLDVGPKFVLIAQGETPYNNFDSFPDYSGPCSLHMVSEQGTSVRHYKSVADVDLESIVSFISSGNAYSIHTKRMLGNMAWWAKIRGVVNADAYYRAFMGINDLAVLCYAPDAPMSLDERSNFDINDVAFLVGRSDEESYTNISEVVQDCFKLCQKLASVR